MTNTIANLDSDLSVRIISVEIDCNALKGEIRTTVKHDPQTMRVGDASENRTDERVTHSLRSFPTYGRSPGAATLQLARFMAEHTRAQLPDVPVRLFGA